MKVYKAWLPHPSPRRYLHYYYEVVLHANERALQRCHRRIFRRDSRGVLGWCSTWTTMKYTRGKKQGIRGPCFGRIHLLQKHSGLDEHVAHEAAHGALSWMRFLGLKVDRPKNPPNCSRHEEMLCQTVGWLTAGCWEALRHNWSKTKTCLQNRRSVLR